VFGLGTLPSMVTATVAFERVARTLSARATLRNVAGMLLLAFGLWTAGNALYHATAGHGGTHSGHTANEHAGHEMPAAPASDDPHAGHRHPQ
jgi:sulfite exporter TauE/SafE